MERWSWKASFLLVGVEPGGPGPICIWPWVVKATRKVSVMGTIYPGGGQTESLPARAKRQAVLLPGTWVEAVWGVCRLGVLGKGWGTAGLSVCMCGGGTSASGFSSVARTFL